MGKPNFAEPERRPGLEPSSAAYAPGGWGAPRGAWRALPERAGWTLLEKCGEALLLAAPDGTVRHANAAAHRLFGYDYDKRDAIAGRNWLAWAHPGDEESLSSHLDALRRTPDGSSTIEVRLRHAAGEWRCCELLFTNLLDDPDIGALLVQARDVTQRRLRDENARASEAQFAEAQRLASLGCWEWDVESGQLLWTDELFYIFGLQPGESDVTYEGFLTRLHDDDRDRMDAALQRSVRERRTLDYRCRIVRPSGAVRTVHWRARVVSDGAQVRLLSGIAQDVTENLLAERELRESEARFRRIADSNIIGIVSWDAQGRITEANDAFLRIAGYTRSDLWEGRVHWDELTPPEYRDADALALQELADTGVCSPYEKEYIRKDGSRVPILMGAAYLEPGVSGDQGICFVLDMSERRRVEAALRESEARYRRLVENSPDAIFVHANGQILFANAEGAQLLGARSAAELVGRRVLDVIYRAGRLDVQERLAQWTRGAVPDEILQTRLLRLDGVEVEAEISSSPMMFQEQFAVQSLARDVTSRNRLQSERQAQLLRQEEQLRALVENISDGLAILSVEGELFYQSPSIERITGYSFEELSRGVFDVVHPDDRERVRRTFEAISANPGEVRSVEYRLRHKDGSWCVLESLGRTLPPGGPFEGILVTTRETAWRRAVENRLLEVSSELQAIYDAFPDIYLRLDSDGVILAYHAADISRFLLPPEQFFGRRVQELLPSPASEMMAAALQQVARTRRPARVEYELPFGDKPRCYEARLQPLLDSQIVAIVRDTSPDAFPKVEGHSEMAATPLLADESVASLVNKPGDVLSLGEILGEALQNTQAPAAARGVHLTDNMSCALETLGERQSLLDALQALLNGAIASCRRGGNLHIGCEARIAERPAAQGPRLRGRVRLHITGQGETSNAEARSAVSRAQELLQPHDGEAGVETIAPSFVFWLDLPAARIL